MSEMLKDLKTVLTSVISDSSRVFIIGHNEPDFDSIGSAIGLYTICHLLGRKAYIVVADAMQNIEPGVRKIIEENKNKFNIIDLDTYTNLLGENSSLIVTDTNKVPLIAVRNDLAKFKYKVVIDHHSSDKNTIKIDEDYLFINESASSSSELVAQVLNSYRFNYDKDVANFLLAGIELDTNRYRNNTTSTTHNVARRLINRGADPSIVTRLFRTEFETDRKINDLVYNGTLFETYEYSIFRTRQVSFTINRHAPQTIYKKETLAKVADKMLEYNVDASFAIGKTDKEIISVSARSKSDINVGKIMSLLNGGGNATSAACKVIDSSVEEVESMLKDHLKSYLFTLDSIETVTLQSPLLETDKVYQKIKL